MRKSILLCAALAALMAAAPAGAYNVVVYQALDEPSLALQPSSDSVIRGMIGTLLAGGWHPVNTNPADQLAAFTDGALMSASGLSGLLNDFPGSGNPANVVQYDLLAPVDVAQIRVFSGNHFDGRAYHTYTVEFSDNGGFTWTNPIYVQSHPSGYSNNNNFPNLKRAVSVLSDPSGTLMAGVTNVRFSLYSTSNTQGWMWDPFDGVNPFTGVDDGFPAAFESPLILELEVIPVPEPGTLAVLGSALLGMGAMLRRRA